MCSADLSNDTDDGVRWFIVDLTSYEVVAPIAVEFDFSTATLRLEQIWAAGVQVLLLVIEPDKPLGSFRIFAVANIDKAVVERDGELMEAIAAAIGLSILGVIG